MQREEVARNQRARLYGAMIEAVTRRGYAATSVAEVVALAGVSRRALYELFSDKEDCFLATCDSAVARARKVMLDAWASERGWANRLHASCKALLDDIASFPKPARLVLVESLAVGPSVRERTHLAGRIFERLVSVAFSCAPGRPDLPGLHSKAIVAGVRHVLFLRLREGREQEFYVLSDEVLDWCESCRSPLIARLGASAAADGPPRRPVPLAFRSGREDRARALTAITYLALELGYDELTDPQIAQFAGMSTEAFHEQFTSKQAAFLALLDVIAEDALASVRERIGDACWPESVNLGVSAFVDYLVSHEALARIAFVELYSLGPGLVDRLTGIVDELTRLLTERGPGPCRGPLLAKDAVAGALWGIISSCVLNNRVGQLPRVAEHLSFLVQAPYIGAEAAVESIEGARGRRSSR
ncbi:MAG TPA: TetR/AcrR family transcriptional regulator [Solirubrobacteraceae bacterium]|jgi:AcrR family transcriptional regulator|nr:TetR/AcrR family transcriptional regulator [Solirubrobacteraceae bacterium]